MSFVWIRWISGQVILAARALEKISSNFSVLKKQSDESLHTLSYAKIAFVFLHVVPCCMSVLDSDFRQDILLLKFKTWGYECFTTYCK